MPNVKRIEASVANKAEFTERVTRVAAYARVSTEHDEQDGSYEIQVKYFTEKINATPGWVLAGVYADKGISGTCVNGREEFIRMINDAMAGKIDLILTKSISRFARNTVTTLETIRELRAAGTSVIFEKENLNTGTQQGELMLTILSALAEQESRSISENIQWGIQAKFKEGKDVHNFYHFTGYEKGWKINEDEAETVRLIYRLYLSGSHMSDICRELERLGVPRQDGGKRWHSARINYILHNPAYCGDILLQKTYTVDFRGRVRKKNEGEVPMYYVEGHHPAIVSRYTYEKVQLRLKRKLILRTADYSVSPFFRSVFADNGSGSYELNYRSCNTDAKCPDSYPLYKRVTLHKSTNKYRHIIWKPDYDRLSPVRYPTLSENELYRIFHLALCRLSARAKGLKHTINNNAARAQAQIAGIETEREMRRSELMKLLNRIAAVYGTEEWEILVKEYNSGLEEYEKLGDEQWTLEERNRRGAKLLSLLPEIKEYAAICTDGNARPPAIAVLYRKSDAFMMVSNECVTVNFGAGITERINIEKRSKGWTAL